MNENVMLIDHDSKMPNLALMKLSAHHKALGDNVFFNMPLWPSDVTYVSKVFPFSPPVSLPGNVVVGGPGSGSKLLLPDELDSIRPDYSLYRLEYSMGFTTRGCPRGCSFCIVPGYEGKFRVVSRVKDWLHPDHDQVVIMDNNILADMDHAIRELSWCHGRRLKVKIEQGVDVRLITHPVAQLLASLRFDSLRVSFDALDYVDEFRHGIEILSTYLPSSRIMCFILAGYESGFGDAFLRYSIAKSLGLYPWVMIYNKRRDNDLLTWFQKWANRRCFQGQDFDSFLRSYGQLDLLAQA